MAVHPPVVGGRKLLTKTNVYRGRRTGAGRVATVEAARCERASAAAPSQAPLSRRGWWWAAREKARRAPRSRAR
eukprot:scaffold23950_cov63-Phaeocystis_antarctica.AAC.5